MYQLERLWKIKQGGDINEVRRIQIRQICENE